MRIKVPSREVYVESNPHTGTILRLQVVRDGKWETHITITDIPDRELTEEEYEKISQMIGLLLRELQFGASGGTKA